MRAAILCALLAAAPALAQGDPDADRLVVIHAQSVITVSGETFTPGSIVIRNGEIEAVGARVDVPPQARVIDARDQVAMPALINPRTRFSLGSYSRSGNNASRSRSTSCWSGPGSSSRCCGSAWGSSRSTPQAAACRAKPAWSSCRRPARSTRRATCG